MHKCKDAKNGVTHLTYILASLHIYIFAFFNFIIFASQYNQRL